MKTNNLNIAFGIAAAMWLSAQASYAQHEKSRHNDNSRYSGSHGYSEPQRQSNTAYYSDYNAHNQRNSRHESRTVIVEHYPQRHPVMVVERQRVFEPGYCLSRLPERALVISLDGIRYYYYGGAFFRASHRGGYVVVAPPVHIKKLPIGGKTCRIDGRMVVDFNGLRFEAIRGGYAYYR
jgi:hypothetical protein